MGKKRINGYVDEIKSVADFLSALSTKEKKAYSHKQVLKTIKKKLKKRKKVK